MWAIMMSTNCYKKMRRAGFTLIEVLAAVAILGGAVFILLNAHFSALKMHGMMVEEVEQRQMLEWLAAKAEVDVLQGMLSGSGDFEPRNPQYTWSYTATLEGQESGMDTQRLGLRSGSSASDVNDVLLYRVEATLRMESFEEEKMLTFYVYNIMAPDLADENVRRNDR